MHHAIRSVLRSSAFISLAVHVAYGNQVFAKVYSPNQEVSGLSPARWKPHSILTWLRPMPNKGGVNVIAVGQILRPRQFRTFLFGKNRPMHLRNNISTAYRRRSRPGIRLPLGAIATIQARGSTNETTKTRLSPSVVSAYSVLPVHTRRKASESQATFDEIEDGNQIGDDARNRHSREIDSANVLEGGQLKTEALTLSRQISYESKCYPRRGAGTRIFVIDTGCRASHEQLRGRVQTLASPGSPYNDGNDDHGHGTHVAATIAGRDFGVAKSAKITCIKALSSTNSGSSRDVISAINHVIFLKKRESRNRMNSPEAFLMSISLGVKAPKSYSALDNAVNRAARVGIVPIIAAGNMAGDACTFTPARATGAITVGALTGRHQLASFSNRGKCVAMAAPGVAIRSAYHNTDRSYARSSGTSMAAPHISGLAALILGEQPGLRPGDVLREMRRDTRRIDGIPVAKVHQSCPPLKRRSYAELLHRRVRSWTGM